VQSLLGDLQGVVAWIFRRGDRLATWDHVIEITKPRQKPNWMTAEASASAPASIVVRECKITGRVLVTTICDPSVRKSELGELYQQRWHVELDIRNIKDAMGMNIVSLSVLDDGYKLEVESQGCCLHRKIHRNWLRYFYSE